MANDNSRLRLNRNDSPCQNCTERFHACSDRCPKDERGEVGYKAWRAELDRIRANERAYKNLPFSPVK